MQISLMLSRSSKELPRETDSARAQGSSVGFLVPKCWLAVESSQAQADSICMHSGACLGWACARGLRPWAVRFRLWGLKEVVEAAVGEASGRRLGAPFKAANFGLRGKERKRESG